VYKCILKKCILFYFRELSKEYNLNPIDVHKSIMKNPAKKDFYFYQGKYLMNL